MVVVVERLGDQVVLDVHVRVEESDELEELAELELEELVEPTLEPLELDTLDAEDELEL